jgi:formamidopyrimidine-DNA glycosylase
VQCQNFLRYRGAKAQRYKGSKKVGALPGNATHVIFHLDQDSVLYYNDIRQFGWIKIIKTDEVSELPFFKGLGPEPLNNLPAGRQGLTIQQFSNILKKGKGPIKPLLMDQKKIAGVGNIYANEALYLAKIHPKRPASSLSEELSENLPDLRPGWEEVQELRSDN